MRNQEIIHKLYSVNLKNGSRFGVENLKKLLNTLNVPYQKLPAIHVAGTNGKGSTSTKIAASLKEAGYKVGLYTSPHISTFRERIKINEVMISTADVEELFPQIFETSERLGIEETFFEYITALAFSYFTKKNVDFIVLETGLGGRLDATNICSPILTVITSISLDHTQVLGSTIEEITKEKAGIIKPEVPVVIGPHVPIEYILPISQKLQSPIFQVTDLHSNFEEENRLITKKALEVLSEKIFIPTKAQEKGLTSLPSCRFEEVSQEQLIQKFGNIVPYKVILDVGHNPDGINRLVERLKITFKNYPVTVLYGASKDKDYSACIKLLADYAKKLILVEAESERAATVTELIKSSNIESVFPSSTLIDGLTIAFSEAAKNREILLITGTFFIMQKARKFLGFKDEEDLQTLHDKITTKTLTFLDKN